MVERQIQAWRTIDSISRNFLHQKQPTHQPTNIILTLVLRIFFIKRGKLDQNSFLEIFSLRSSNHYERDQYHSQTQFLQIFFIKGSCQYRVLPHFYLLLLILDLTLQKFDLTLQMLDLTIVMVGTTLKLSVLILEMPSNFLI